MGPRHLREIIETGESDTVEFKRKFSGYEKIAKEMIALANTRGGHILVGVDDDGRIVGVDSEKSEIDLLATTAEFYCDPPVEVDFQVVEIDREDVIVIAIPESKAKPHRLLLPDSGKSGGDKSTADEAPNGNGRVYIRQGSKSMVASREVERVLATDHPDAPPLRLQIGWVEKALFEYLEQNGRITLRQFRQLVNISERRASRALVALVRAGLIRIFTHEAEDYYTLK